MQSVRWMVYGDSGTAVRVRRSIRCYGIFQKKAFVVIRYDIRNNFLRSIF